jgi:hypothetical protein
VARDEASREAFVGLSLSTHIAHCSRVSAAALFVHLVIAQLFAYVYLAALACVKGMYVSVLNKLNSGAEMDVFAAVLKY